MPNEQLNIWVNLKDKMSQPLRKMGGVVNKFKQHWLGITVALAGVTLAFRKLSRTIQNFYSGVLQTSSTIEQMGTKLKVLLGSVEEGNKAFENMRDLASKVPFEFENIMQSATDLAGVVKNGNEDIKELMPIIADIAAGTGMKVREVTSQMIRVYSAGIASADMFRERGVSAALGFEAGVRYSAEDSINAIIKAWENGTSKFKGATDELAKTWEGTVSMMKDAWFNFRAEIGEDFFKEIKKDLQALYIVIQKSKEEGGEYAKVVKDLKQALVDGYESGKEFMLFMIEATAQLGSAWHRVAFVTASVLKLWTQAVLLQKKVAVALGKATGEPQERIKAYQDEVKEYQARISEANKILQEEFSAIDDNVGRRVVNSVKKLLREMNNVKNNTVDLGEISVEKTEEVNEKLMEQLTLWQKINNSIKAGLEEAEKEYTGFEDYIKDATKEVVSALEQSFGDFFYNVFTGQLRDASAVFAEFGKSILRSFSNILAKMAAEAAISGFLNFFSPSPAGGQFGGGSGGGSAMAMSGTATLGGGQTGIESIPMTGRYLLHRGERVVPAEESAGRNVTYNIYAVDPQSFRSMLYQNKASIDILVGDSVERNSQLRNKLKKYGR